MKHNIGNFVTKNDDRTGRWMILWRHEHKDGGYFWSGPDFVDQGETTAEALRAYLDKETFLTHRRYKVFLWADGMEHEVSGAIS